MNTLGDAPIEQEVRETMTEIARLVDQAFNGSLRGEARRTGFVLLVFPFYRHDGRANYISNARREDVLVMLREQVARFEGAPDQTGHG